MPSSPPRPQQDILLAVTCGRWRKWPLSYFAQLVASLPEHRFTLVGQKAELLSHERPLLQELERNPRVTNLLDRTTVLELIRLISSARAVVTSDTAAHHIANVYGRPGVVMFGPVLPEVWSPQPESLSPTPIARGLKVLHDRTCPFFPCHYQVRCRQPDDWCMTKIRPEMVRTALLKEIAEREAT